MNRNSQPFGHKRYLLIVGLGWHFATGIVGGANIYVSSLASDFASNRTIVDGAGAPVRAGTGVVAVGSFATWNDGQLAAAASSPSGLNQMLSDFRPHGQAARFGAGFDLAGSFDLDASGPMMPGNPLIGKSIYIIGATPHGLFLFKTQETFHADAPISAGYASIAEAGSGHFILGSDGPFVTLDRFDAPQQSIMLAGSATGESLDFSMLEVLVPAEQSIPPPLTPPSPPNSISEVPPPLPPADAPTANPVDPTPPPLDEPSAEPPFHLIHRPTIISRIDIDAGYLAGSEVTWDGQFPMINFSNGAGFPIAATALSTANRTTFSATIPEPASSALCLCSAALAMVMRRRQSNGRIGRGGGMSFRPC
jgi:hypothetical protein